MRAIALTQKQAESKVAAFFKKHADDSDTITANQLAELLNRSAKVVRAHMRQVAVRDQSQEKHNRYAIDREIATQELLHFDSAKRMTRSS